MNRRRFFVLGATAAALVATAKAGIFSACIPSPALSIPATTKLYLDGGADTYILESGADNITLTAGGVL